MPEVLVKNANGLLIYLIKAQSAIKGLHFLQKIKLAGHRRQGIWLAADSLAGPVFINYERVGQRYSFGS